MRKIDRSALIGKTIGSWYVIGFPEIANVKYPGLMCRCACGEVREIPVSNLISGKSRTCINCRNRFGSDNSAWKGAGDIPGHLFGVLLRSAAVRGVVVEITMQDLQESWDRQGGICAISGQSITIGGQKRGFTASVDRIDSKIGYTKENIQWVHKHVNLMKNHFDEQYFIDTCERITMWKSLPKKAAA